jgi:hypothetical protein
VGVLLNVVVQKPGQITVDRLRGAGKKAALNEAEMPSLKSRHSGFFSPKTGIFATTVAWLFEN